MILTDTEVTTFSEEFITYDACTRSKIYLKVNYEKLNTTGMTRDKKKITEEIWKHKAWLGFIYNMNNRYC